MNSRRTTSSRVPRPRDDAGSAMIMTLLVMVLVGVLATTVSVLAIENLRSSWRAQQAGSALNAADAGVSAALAHLRSAGVTRLPVCSVSCDVRPASGDPLLSDDGLPSSTGQSYDVWIVALTPFTGSNVGSYRIWSRGRAAGDAERVVRVDVEVQARSGVSRGIFARQVYGGGSASVTHQSVFSTECVYDRDKIDMTKAGLDAAYGIPAGVHSSSFVTTAAGNGGGGRGGNGNGNGQAQCSQANSIHAPADCNPTYPFDHDREGGPIAGTVCEDRFRAAMAGATKPAFADIYPDGSRISTADQLYDVFDIDPRLPDSLAAALKMMALSQSNLVGPSQLATWTVPDETNAVMYFDLTTAPDSKRTVNLNQFDGSLFDPTTWDDDPADAGCPQRSLVIVVDGGNVDFNANLDLAAALFLTSSSPYGQVLKANGTANFVGTVVADVVNLVGNVDFSLTECFLRNTSPALLEVSVVRYLESY